MKLKNHINIDCFVAKQRLTDGETDGRLHSVYKICEFNFISHLHTIKLVA